MVMSVLFPVHGPSVVFLFIKTDKSVMHVARPQELLVSVVAFRVHTYAEVGLSILLCT